MCVFVCVVFKLEHKHQQPQQKQQTQMIERYPIEGSTVKYGNNYVNVVVVGATALKWQQTH